MNENIYKLNIPDHLVELIRGLHPHLKKKVRFSLEKVVNAPRTGKALKEELAGFYSYRISNFRIIYRISERKVIELVAIGPRRTIYEETLKIIRQEPSTHKVM